MAGTQVLGLHLRDSKIIPQILCLILLLGVMSENIEFKTVQLTFLMCLKMTKKLKLCSPLFFSSLRKKMNVLESAMKEKTYLTLSFLM
jgi:hypothetical protein